MTLDELEGLIRGELEWRAEKLARAYGDGVPKPTPLMVRDVAIDLFKLAQLGFPQRVEQEVTWLGQKWEQMVIARLGVAAESGN